MTAHAWITLGIVIGAIVLFASEKVRVDLVALIVLALLAALRIVTPDEALAGFSNEATVTVAAMFALSLGIERSGALEPLVAVLTRIRRPWLLTLALMLTIAPIGAFVKNIALVATFLPLALRVCARSRTSPARVLMPMAFAAQMGGVCTLIGTSSNLLADSLAQKHGLPAFGVFEFTKMGALLAVAGIAYLMLIGRWLLPREIDADVPAETEIGKYVTELKVTPQSSLLGKTIADAKLGEKHGVYPLELLRGERHLWSPRSQRIEAGDVLLVRGAWEKIEELRKRAELEIDPENRYGPDHGQARVLVEAMVKPQSMVVGSTLGELQLQRNFDAIALAIHRRGRVLREKLRDVRLDGGDVLMLLVGGEGVDTLRADEHFVVLSEREDARRFSRRAIAAMAIMVCGRHRFRLALAADPGRRDGRCRRDGDFRLLRPQGHLRRHRLEDHRAARRDPAARHRDREQRPFAARGRCRHGSCRHARTSRRAAHDVSSDRAADRADGPQPVGRADGRHRGRHRAHDARRSAAVRYRRRLRRGDLVRHAGRLSDQHDGLLRWWL